MQSNSPGARLQRHMKERLRVVIYGNAIVALVAVTYFFALPAAILVQALSDPGLRMGKIPRIAFRWHRSLSERFEPWARKRIASGRATQLSTSNISGTEWPLFSSVFYLWATEALQDAWKKDPSLSRVMPSEYARGAIEAVTALVADPNHATWVKAYWGDEYLRRENLFYRMLLISGLTCHQKLLGDKTYQSLLSDQVEALANEIDRSPFGLLDDYPAQCYPVDVLAAIAAIRKADAVLGTDHAAFATRAVRAFEGTRLDSATGLPAYFVASKTGLGLGSARGCGLSFMLVWAPELWPETAQQWYARYQEHFWQEGWLFAGFREFPQDHSIANWQLFDVDAGPVLAGYGTAASAFGVGAARANGDLEHAYPLSAQALVASWPLPDGTLLLPSFLSNLSDAPFTGESALLFSLTRQSIMSSTVTAGRLPVSVYLALGGYFVTPVVGFSAVALQIKRWEKGFKQKDFLAARWQLSLWLIFVGTGALAFMLSWQLTSVLLLLSAQFLPRRTVREVV
jgi:hypothetical protein